MQSKKQVVDSIRNRIAVLEKALASVQFTFGNTNTDLENIQIEKKQL